MKEFLREEFQQFQHKGLHLDRKRKENSENSLLLLFSFCWFFVLADNDYFLLLLLLMLWCWSTALHCFDVDILMLINRVALFWCWSTVVHCFYVDCWSTGLHCFDVVPARLVGGCCWTTLAACAPFFSETVATSPPPRSHPPSALLRPKKTTQCTQAKKEQKCCEVAPLRQLIKKLNHACINNQIRSKQKLRFYIICKSEEDYRLVLQCDNVMSSHSRSPWKSFGVSWQENHKCFPTDICTYSALHRLSIQLKHPMSGWEEVQNSRWGERTLKYRMWKRWTGKGEMGENL